MYLDVKRQKYIYLFIETLKTRNFFSESKLVHVYTYVSLRLLFQNIQKASIFMGCHKPPHIDKEGKKNRKN